MKLAFIASSSIISFLQVVPRVRSGIVFTSPISGLILLFRRFDRFLEEVVQARYLAGPSFKNEGIMGLGSNWASAPILEERLLVIELGRARQDLWILGLDWASGQTGPVQRERRYLLPQSVPQYFLIFRIV